MAKKKTNVAFNEIYNKTYVNKKNDPWHPLNRQIKETLVYGRRRKCRNTTT